MVNKVVNVSFQDPNHMTGGQGVSTLNRSRTLLDRGYEVDWVSLRIKGEQGEEQYTHLGKPFQVSRLSVSDSDTIVTPYEGDENQQYQRRVEFFKLAKEHIKSQYDPGEVYVHLHGFYIVPMLAGALPEYNTVSVYNLLLTPRMDLTGEHTDPMYDTIKAAEVLSIHANRKIQAITPGMKEEILGVGSYLSDRQVRRNVRNMADFFGIDLDQIEADVGSLDDRVMVVPHGIGMEFYIIHERPQNPDRVVAWGRVSPEKGFEHLIEAAESFPDKEFLIFGTVDDTERARQDYTSLLENMASDLDNVTLDFRVGGVRGRELMTKIDSAAIVAMPSLYEPFGLVNVEALARSRPVITTTTTGGRYIMESEEPAHRDYGYVVDKDSGNLTMGLEDSLGHFFDLPIDKRDRMEQAARNRANFFRWDNRIPDILAMYEG
jgi:glycosyltransferase involved in cell wall biosynthesis|tara:strand:+ start:709 stop:2007 length:1299 start_codon:yes stop_codon:yes gene_type:complete